MIKISYDDNERGYLLLKTLKAELERKGVADALGVLRRGTIGGYKSRIWVDVASEDMATVSGFKRIEMHK